MPYDSKEMQKLMYDVDKHIQERCSVECDVKPQINNQEGCLNSNCHNSHAVTVYDVQQSLKQLKKRKKMA